MEYTTVLKRKWIVLTGYAILAACLLAVAYLAGYVIRDIGDKDSKARLNLLGEAQQIVLDNYLGQQPSDAQSQYAMIRGMLEALGDPYTTFSEPHETELHSDNLSGAFGGVGARVRKNTDGEFVLNPIPGQPAERAGILDGDALVEVDGVNITPSFSLSEVVARIRGQVGSQVILRVRTGEGPKRRIAITRARIVIPSVSWRRMDRDQTIGILDIDRFSERTADEVREGFDALYAGGVSKIILDLRSNGGGSLQASVEVASMFLDGGVILHEVRRGKPEETYTASEDTISFDLPLVVLVDRGSASASEILAGALQEQGRAALIGETTFGKGSVQLVFDMSDGSSLRVTNARWYTPERSPLDGRGLEPDMLVDSKVHVQDDPYLARAVEYLDGLP